MQIISRYRQENEEKESKANIDFLIYSSASGRLSSSSSSLPNVSIDTFVRSFVLSFGRSVAPSLVRSFDRSYVAACATTRKGR